MTERHVDVQSRLDELLSAVYREDISRLQALLTAGLPINTPDSDGRTALMHAVLASPASAQIVAYLLANGADVNTADKSQRWTALHFAARDGNSEILCILLRNGAFVDSVDLFGNTPMWRATFTAPRNPKCLDCVKLLLEAGANPDTPNKSGVSARTLAHDPGQEATLRLIEAAGDPK